MDWSLEHPMNGLWVGHASTCCIKHTIFQILSTMWSSPERWLAHLAPNCTAFPAGSAHVFCGEFRRNRWRKSSIGRGKIVSCVANIVRGGWACRWDALLVSKLCGLCLDWDWQPCCRKAPILLVTGIPSLSEYRTSVMSNGRTTSSFDFCVKATELQSCRADPCESQLPNSFNWIETSECASFPVSML